MRRSAARLLDRIIVLFFEEEGIEELASELVTPAMREVGVVLGSPPLAGELTDTTKATDSFTRTPEDHALIGRETDLCTL